MLKRISLIVLFITLLSNISFAQKVEKLFLPKWETKEEKTRHHEIGSNLRETPPPEGDVTCPGEFEYCEGVIFAWEGYENLVADLIDATQEIATAWVVVDNAAEQASAESYLQGQGIPLDNVEFLLVPLNSVWMRDYGPWGIYLDTGERAIIDPIYNRPRPLDDAFPGELGDLWGMEVYEPDWIHPGGNFMTDGLGVGFSTTLVYEENPGWNEETLEEYSSDYLGIEEWHALTRLPEFIEYTGHCDMFVKLLDNHTVIVGEYPNGHPGKAVLDQNAEYFESIVNGNGEPYEVYRIPMGSSNGACRSYTNSLIINEKVLVPIYGDPNDQAGLDVYESLMPEHEIIPFDCGTVILSGGAVHCITMQFPGDLRWAIEGTVNSGETRETLAEVEVFTSGDGEFTSTTDENGEFHVRVTPGAYELHLRRFGYYDWDSDEEFTFDEPDTVDLELTMMPLPTGILSGFITDINGNAISGAELTPMDVPMESVFSDGSGYYEFSTIPGDYTYNIQVYAPDFDWQIQEITVPVSGEAQLDFVLMSVQSFELSDGGFTAQGEWEWGIPTEEGGPAEAYMGEKCWGIDMDGEYNNNQNINMYSCSYTISDASIALLKFYHWYEITDGWDGGNVQLSLDDGDNWQIIIPEGNYPDNSIIALGGQAGYTGESEGWIMAEFDLTPHVSNGDEVKFRFRFASTNSPMRGWFIDNVVVYGSQQEPSSIGDTYGLNVPGKYALSQNFPNPFNPVTRINYQLPVKSHVTLNVFNANGQLVKTLINSEIKAGYHSIVWNGTNESGTKVPSGIYIYRIEINDFTQDKRCILLK